MSSTSNRPDAWRVQRFSRMMTSGFNDDISPWKRCVPDNKIAWRFTTLFEQNSSTVTLL